MKTISVIGLGNRGFEYMNFLKYFHRKETKVVAICDISPRALEDVGKRFKIGTDMRFSSADDFFKQGVLSDGLIISTQDKTHFEITKNAILAGYKYILLEKPVSDNIDECETLDRLAKENNVQLVVCHVLRYATYYRKIMEIIRSGAIGDLVHIDHTENVGYFHFAHSYVRGNWKREDTSTPSLLAKCCHDIDLLYWFADSEPTEVYSHGNLKYFKKENAPEGATEFCLGGCKNKKNCPYDAEFTYITSPPHKTTFVKFNRRTMTGKCGATKKDMYECLKNTSYGKCVFLNDNNVCDIQSVDLKFKNGITAHHTMTAFSQKCMRTSHFMGTKGELICEDKKLWINIFGKGKKKVHAGITIIPSHGEADIRTISSFVDLLYGRLKNKEDVTNIETTLVSHKIVMAAEQSRHTNQVIKL